jgi:putative transposase
VDTLGRVLKAKVYAADITDREGARLLLAPLPSMFTRLRHLWVDRGYRGPVPGWISTHLGWRLR